ncbi:hypothetical protein CW693_00560 [Candidatus Bathyarchaeota archaeon]|nr:MAG: hypothetical protein CW693_00560 [Candidatus Bathyarchaeota archaeon]
MPRYKFLAIPTKYWRPGENYLEEIIKRVGERLSDGDFVVISEKAVSTALGNLVDENSLKPSLSARLIAKYWMRIIWGYLLGFLCHFGEELLRHMREYPLKMGSRHKQVALQYAGLLQSLNFGSEGGIDGSNLPYAYVCLPLKNACEIARKIREEILLKLGKNVSVMIVDTDRTFSFRNFHFTPRPNSIRGIYSFGGFIAYVVGRLFKLKARATPIAVVGERISVEESLEIANLANRARGSGAGRNVWEMAKKFGVGLTDVTWEMLETVKHKPIVVVRSKR